MKIHDYNRQESVLKNDFKRNCKNLSDKSVYQSDNQVVSNASRVVHEENISRGQRLCRRTMTLRRISGRGSRP